jgi:ATP-dependent Clp protease ATP-binding subunit ClpB
VASRAGTLQLDPYRLSRQTRGFKEALRGKVAGQDEAVNAIVNLYQVLGVGLNCPGRPVGNLLFLGPTGTGKTRVVEATAEVLFGSAEAVIKVDCAEFQQSHEIAKLIGSPPGYIGHGQTEPLITSDTLARYHTDQLRISLLLFDEIEKGCAALWQLLLGVLDKGMLTLGDNRRVDLSQTVIFMTSNLGGREITALMNEQFGFAPPVESKAPLRNKIENIAINAAKKRFLPEFMNRLDNVVVFRTLEPEELDRILEIELGLLQKQIEERAERPFLLRLTAAAKAFLLQEGTMPAYGARHLRRAIQQHLVVPIANLLSTEQVSPDVGVFVDWREKSAELTFLRDSRVCSNRGAAHFLGARESPAQMQNHP